MSTRDTFLSCLVRVTLTCRNCSCERCFDLNQTDCRRHAAQLLKVRGQRWLASAAPPSHKSASARDCKLGPGQSFGANVVLQAVRIVFGGIPFTRRQTLIDCCLGKPKVIMMPSASANADFLSTGSSETAALWASTVGPMKVMPTVLTTFVA